VRHKQVVVVKPFIALCLLVLSPLPCAAQELSPGGGPSSYPPPPTVGPIVTEWLNAPVLAAAPPGVQAPQPALSAPVIIGPDAGSFSSQYQPPAGPPAAAPPTFSSPAPLMQPGLGAPGADCGCNPSGGPLMGAPLMGGPGMVSPGGLVEPGLMEPIFPYTAQTPDVTMLPTTIGGPLPNRYGWVSLYDFGLLPASSSSDDFGDVTITEFNLDWKYTAPLFPSPFVFSYTQQYGLRLWDGPTTAPGLTTNLPGSAQHIGWDFEMKSTLPGPWNGVVAFNPSINSDFEASLSSDAWNWDGRGAVLYSPSREVTWVFGAAYWDRVNDRVIPWAGMIYRPNQYWQWDLVFPQLRVSLYLWDELGFRTSLYGRAEYHVEAYEIYNPVVDQRDKVEFEDWRALIGVNKDRGDFAYFFEGGWVFGRNVAFKSAEQGFDMSSGAIVRAGLRF
jgi:hypothetical protein